MGDLTGFEAWLRSYSPAGYERWQKELAKTAECARVARAAPKGAQRITAFIACRKKQ